MIDYLLAMPILRPGDGMFLLRQLLWTGLALASMALAPDLGPGVQELALVVLAAVLVGSIVSVLRRPNPPRPS